MDRGEIQQPTTVTVVAIMLTNPAQQVLVEGVSVGLARVHVNQEVQKALGVRLHHNLTLGTGAADAVCLQAGQRYPVHCVLSHRVKIL